ncbi:hypothetical protein AX17_003933 [Amanita inopinata Kibby_2008]|nr:hypothetical protein AX17_003933 [Amanita inopinata Kibby_2008]
MSRQTSFTPNNDGQNILDFIQTGRYQGFEDEVCATANSSSDIVVPPSWNLCRHPNGDIYFHNPDLCLVTPDDITDPDKLTLVVESWEDHMLNMEYDPVGKQLGDDWELILSDATESSVMIEMISRSTGIAYRWCDEAGLRPWQGREHFWSILAAYPSHRLELPPGVESEFIHTLSSAKAAIKNGVVFPLSAEQINGVISQYEQLKGVFDFFSSDGMDRFDGSRIALQAEGRNVMPMLTWLMGSVMPLESTNCSTAAEGRRACH